MVKDKTAIAECISDDALVHLKSYKYSSIDKSPLSKYVLGPYWNAFVQLLPLWLAPNMVTLLGFFFIVGNVALLVIYMPDLAGPGPAWLYFSFAFGMWMYQTMDNVDGKQARRTGQSSGLGELFDHGIDSLNCTLASLCELAALGLGSTKMGIFTAMTPCIPMFFSTWETYHTHSLYLGVFNGPTEGLVGAAAIMLVSGIYGPQIWRQPIANLTGFDSILGTTSIVDIWVPLITFCLIVGHIPPCVWHVYKARRSRNQPMLPVFLEWTPFAIFYGASAAWLYSPHSTILSDNHVVLFCVTMSFVFGRFTTKIILAHLTRQEFPYWTILMAPLVLAAVAINLPYLGLAPISAYTETCYLWVYLVFAAIVYSRWAYLVTSSICRYLDINCLTITPRLFPGNAKKVDEASTTTTLPGAALASGPTTRLRAAQRNGDSNGSMK